ncbi:MAG: tetratricopeptide repeat protein [Patescibacteria group bacterium]
MRPLSIRFVSIYLFAFVCLTACDFGFTESDAGPRPPTDADQPATEPFQREKVLADRIVPRLLVVPFESQSVPRSAKQYTFALAGMLAERLESESAVHVVNGPLVLTREQAQLLQSDGSATEAAIASQTTINAAGEPVLNNSTATYDPAQFMSLAKAAGAEYVLAGRFSGPIWDCKIDVEVWRIGTRLNKDGVTETYRELAARHDTKSDWTVPGKSRYGRDIRLTSAAKIHESFAEAVSGALAKANIRLSPATVEAVKTSSTRDAYALLLLARAYVAMYFDETGESERVIKAAAHAMSVDPRHYEAQRLYAQLLYEGGNRLAARAHFEMAIEKNPNDVRSLVRLGVIETMERNNSTARDYLHRAAELRPNDAEIAYWTGRAALAQNDRRTALSQFERARDLDPDHTDSRRELAQLYSAAQRYDDAADELMHVVELVPSDCESNLLLGACLRAAGRILDAASAYASGAEQFSGDNRFPKFEGDMLLLAGQANEARSAYRRARWLDFFDRRMSRAVGKSIVAAPQIGSTELLETINAAYALRDELVRNRFVYYLGTNDAILDLINNGSEACLDGHGASSAVMAMLARERFDEVREQQSSLAWRVNQARDYGEWDALTPDERQRAETVVADWRSARQDATEMRTQYQRTLLPLYNRNNCGEYDGPLNPATVEEVLARHQSRVVVMPPARRVPMLPIAPDVPPQAALAIRFTIDNTEGQTDVTVVLDGSTAGTVPAGESVTFDTTVGPHDLCVERDALSCSRPANVRNLYLHDGLRIRQRR